MLTIEQFKLIQECIADRRQKCRNFLEYYSKGNHPPLISLEKERRELTILNKIITDHIENNSG